MRVVESERPGSKEEVLLKGRRILLGFLGQADASKLFDAVASSRESLKRRVGWAAGVRSLEDTAAFIREAGRRRDEESGVYFGIFEKKDEGLIGVGSLCSRNSRSDSRAKIGLWIRSDRQNRGYATEAARVLCEYGFNSLGLHRIYARIDPANRPSRKVLMKLGFRYEGTLRDEKKLNGRWIAQECWGLLKAEWEK